MKTSSSYSYLDKFENRVFGKGLSWKKISCNVGTIILVIGFLIYIFMNVDLVPATDDDYSLLENQLLQIQEKPENILRMEGNLTIKNGSITYTVENDQCKIIGVYNESYKLVETRREDKAMSKLEFIVGSLGAVALGSIVVFIYFSFLLWLLRHLFLALLKSIVWYYLKIVTTIVDLHKSPYNYQVEEININIWYTSFE